MNCYGTNPRYTRPVQQVSDMNNFGTYTSGEWTQPIGVSPNLPTSPISVQPYPIQQPIPMPQIPMPQIPIQQIPMPLPEPLPPTLTEPIYTPGYLATKIGALMRVEFLIGNSTTDRVGRLKQVGASFIVLTSIDNASDIVCDIYSIKFVTIIGASQTEQMYQLYSQQ